MNDDHGFERTAAEWLDTGSDSTPPNVIDAVLLAVRVTPQERDLRVPWRTSSMTAYLRMAAVIAIVAIVGVAALVGLGFFTAQSAGSGSTPDRTGVPSPTAALQAIPPMAGNGPIALEPGRYLILGPSEGWTRSEGWPQAVSVTVPSGWTIDTRSRGSGLWGVDTTDEVKLNFWSVDNVVADPCKDPQGFDPRMVDPPVGPTVDDLVSTLTSWPGAETTAPADVTLDGFGGKQFDLTLPTGAADCEGDFVVWFAPESHGAPGRGFYLEPGWRHQLWVLDVDGLRFVVNAGIALDASARAESELLQIVKSIDIEP